MALEHVEDCSSGRRIGPIVESQREDRFGMQAAERWTEQLRSRADMPPGMRCPLASAAPPEIIGQTATYSSRVSAMSTKR